jgi:Domain of Unknown Function (DUF1080)
MTKTAVVLLSLCCAVSAAAESHQTRPLFNGQNLSGFYTFLEGRGKNNDPDKVISVADGMIRISGREFGYLATEEEFENYHLTVEFKWGTQTHPPRKDRARDSGILFHFKGPDTASMIKRWTGVSVSIMMMPAPSHVRNHGGTRSVSDRCSM